MWLFQAKTGEVSWHGDATEELADGVRKVLERDWKAPVKMLEFPEADRAKVEAELWSPTPPEKTGTLRGERWWRRG